MCFFYFSHVNHRILLLYLKLTATSFNELILTHFFLLVKCVEDLNNEASASYQERRGILKSNTETYQPKRLSLSPSKPGKSALKPHGVSGTDSEVRSILKPETDHGHDEGISSDNSNSEEEDNSNVKVSSGKDQSAIMSELLSKISSVHRAKASGQVSKYSSKSTTSDETTDESSGGREVRSIIGMDSSAKKRFKEK